MRPKSIANGVLKPDALKLNEAMYAITLSTDLENNLSPHMGNR